MHGTVASAKTLQHCDLFVGGRHPFFGPGICNAGLFAKHCPIIQIDIDPAEFNKNIDVNLRVSGDAKEILRILTEKLGSRSTPSGWHAWPAGKNNTRWNRRPASQTA